MSEWYKFEPLAWDRGTDNLSLEQEAAFLRVCNAIYASDQPIAENYRVLGGLWRCNERKSKRLLSELIDAGKLTIVDGLIHNERAVYDVSIRRELRVKRQSAGVRGGIESGKSRAKALKNNNTTQASGSTREEKRREEYIYKQKDFISFWDIYPKKSGKIACENKFKALVKSGIIPLSIIEGAKKYTGFKTVRDGYIKNPLTWLNQGCWEDEDLPNQVNGSASQADMYRSLK